MNKIAHVLYPYCPNKDDELELTVGDRIEVIDEVEEGWLRGNLKGKVGVFPSNFVQIIETEISVPTTQSKVQSLFGSRISSRNSITSSNSLNNINSNSEHNHNNSINNNCNNSNNLMMNNTHIQHDIDPVGEHPFHSTDDSTNSLGDRKPKPLRGMGYGNIFSQGAKTKPIHTDPSTAMRSSKSISSERLSGPTMDSNTLGRLSSSTLQKQIPKKPPPPAPTDSTSTNGSGPDQAPALPPKPSNQFSPFLQQRTMLNPMASQRVNREQARVIYAYKPSNEDELEMEVGDIINVLDKNSEDAGWWRGELRGKVGVFPDNFVQLIGQSNDISGIADSHNQSRLSTSTNSNSLNNSDSFTNSHQPQATVETNIKSVFATTPEGFSKELESNLEKHNNPASFLSLKRNKIQSQSNLVRDQPSSILSNIEASSGSNFTPTLPQSQSDHGQNGQVSINHGQSSPGKLNHITANRAKGPTRRPPSNILNKRSNLDELANNHNHETSEVTKDLPPASLPNFKLINPVQQSNHSSLTSLPSEQPQPSVPSSIASSPKSGQFASRLSSDITPPTAKPSLPSNNNGTSEISQQITPKTSQRVNQAPMIGQQQHQQPEDIPKPPWMVELRKTNAEKKRDPITVIPTGLAEELNNSSSPIVPSTPAPIVVQNTTLPPTSAKTQPDTVVNLSPLNKLNSTVSSKDSCPEKEIHAKPVDLSEQISKIVASEIVELRNDIIKLQQDLKGVIGLKEVVEVMKVELKTCQSATESQRKYIKELVTNLADERKKIAAMQTEIDRNLK